MVQAEIARRQTLGRAYSGSSIFASKLICGDCGGFYGQKVGHSNDPYRKIEALNEELQVVAELVSQCIKENASKEQSQEEYTRKYNRLVKRYETAVDRLNAATAERDSRMQRDRELRIIIGTIEKQPLVIETWDEGLWLTLLETATVHKDNRMTFRFKNGTDIEVGVE